MDGVFLINKRIGWTSFDVCNRIRKKFNTKRVGHNGTLDPFAEGLMLVAIGRATKILNYLEAADKVYEATLTLGKTTDTLDLTGEVTLEKEVPFLNEKLIRETLSSFVGQIKQTAPLYSALKKDGLPLYYYARNGIEVEAKVRDVNIYSITLNSFTNNTICFTSNVGKGTYIRSLGADIALKLGTVGYLSSLKRIKMAKFDLKDAKDVDEVTENDLISIKDALFNIQTIEVDSQTEIKIRNGVKLDLEGEDIILLINEKQEALALYQKCEDGKYKTLRGLFNANN